MSPSPNKSSGKRTTVAYVLRKFPVLSETFILNEILALEARGVPVHIFSLERPNDPRFHENLSKLKASISYLPPIEDVDGLLKYRDRVAKRYPEGFQKALNYSLSHPGLFWRFLQSCYIADQVLRFRVGHFHSHFATRSTSLAFLASMISGEPYSFTAHAMDIFKTHLSGTALLRKIEHARFVVTISEFNRRLLEKTAPECTSKIHRIYNGINLDQFTGAEEIPPEPFTFLCVARLVEKKGHSVLLKACRRLAERDLDFRCLIIGKGKLRGQVQNMVKELKLEKHVKFLGALRSGEVIEHFRTAHASVLPCVEGSDGNKDGLPVSLVEALSCGLPVVTTPMTGIPEVIEDGKNGLLVPFGDSIRLANAMGCLVEDRALYGKLRARTRDSVIPAFDMNATILQLEELFRDALA